MSQKAITRQILLLPKTSPNKTVFVLGSTGSGKTTLIANLLLESERFLVIDIKGEYPPQFFPEAVEVRGITALQSALNSNRKRIIFSFADTHGAEEDVTIDLICFNLFTFQRLNSEKLPPITVAFDELNRYTEVNVCPPHFASIIRTGRSFKIEKILGAQWFNTVPTWCRDSFSEVYAFRHTEPAGLALLERFGLDPDEIQNLPPYTCAHTLPTGAEVMHLIPQNNTAKQHKLT